MSDLISRKVVMDWLRELQAQTIIQNHKGNNTLVDTTIEVTVNNFINFIVQAPTAFDTDKVMEQIEKKMFTADLYEHGWDGQTVDNLLCFGDIYKIIGKGGIAE